ncbi:NAD(P)/FAD-dependent oxidoreductase [Helicobacter sp. 23-1045]
MKILILGGGYGGLKCAITLQKHFAKLRGKAQITLISKHDYHYQSTLLHKVAIGTYNARKARIYFRKILDLGKIAFVKDTILRIERDKVIARYAKYDFDYLVIALGFKPNTFNIRGVKEFAFVLHSANTALQIRSHIENKFKDFKFSDDKFDLHFNICGSGFTGVEFAAELANQSKELCDICGISRDLVQINIISKAPKVLPMFSDKLRDIAESKLKKLGINLIVGEVIEVQKDGVMVKCDSAIKVSANTNIWCAGVQGNEVIGKSAFECKNNRIKVNEFLQVPSAPNIFVIGDCALATQRDIIHAPTAQLANQMGEFVAFQLINLARGVTPNAPFSFNHRGTVCSIGHTDGVGFVFRFNVWGELAAFFKNIIENKWILSIGGLKNVLKKGQFRFRSSS